MSGFPTSFSGCNPNIKEKALGTRLPVPVTDNREKCTTNARGHGGGGAGTVWALLKLTGASLFHQPMISFESLHSN